MPQRKYLDDALGNRARLDGDLAAVVELLRAQPAEVRVQALAVVRALVGKA